MPAPLLDAGKALDRDRAIAKLRERAERVVATHPEVRAVILFGSLAEGRATPGSEPDLLILPLSPGGRPMDRPLLYLDAFADLGPPVDLLCFTGREAAGMPVARRAMEGGRVLAGSPPEPASPA